MIYFDNAATTYPKPPRVYDYMDQYYREFGFNARRGEYSGSKTVTSMIEETRHLVADLFETNPQNIVFTPSATIAINQVLQGLDLRDEDNIYFTPFEHNSTLRTLYYLKEKKGVILHKIPIHKNMSYNFEELERLYFRMPPRLTIVSHVSNVCGLIAPIDQLAALSQQHKGKIFVDAAQCAGILPVDLRQIDYYIFSGHKSLYGPFGIGGFVVKDTASQLNPLVFGGTGQNSEQRTMPSIFPSRFEAGSANVQAIAGLNASIKWLNAVTPKVIYEKDCHLYSMMIDVLSEFLDIKILVSKPEKHFGVISITVAGYNPSDLCHILDERFDIQVRAGLHCSPLAHEFLGSLPQGTIRLSPGFFNKEEEIQKLKEVFEEICLV